MDFVEKFWLVFFAYHDQRLGSFLTSTPKYDSSPDMMRNGIVYGALAIEVIPKYLNYRATQNFLDCLQGSIAFCSLISTWFVQLANCGVCVCHACSSSMKLSISLSTVHIYVIVVIPVQFISY